MGQKDQPLSVLDESMLSVADRREIENLVEVVVEDLKEEVDEYMKEFEEEEETVRLEKIRRSREMDDDGFMPVRAKNKAKRITENNLKRKSGNSRSRGEKKPKELTNFYRFQMREEKKEALQSLREQFERDKERVARMKADRKFKPF